MSELEELHAPIVLAAGQRLEARRFKLAPDFAWTTHLAAIYSQEPDVVIRDVELYGSETWLPRWNVATEPAGGPPGIPTGLAGVKLQGARRPRIERVRIEGFPLFAIYAHGATGARMHDLEIRHCFQGLRFGNVEENRNVRVSRLRAGDLWGPGPEKWPGIGGEPSRERPGGWIGSDAIACERTSGLFLDCEAYGELYGAFKWAWGCRDLEIVRLRGPNLQFDGGQSEATAISDVRVSGCTLDKSLARGGVAEKGQALQVSNRVSGLHLRDCTFRAAGQAGHAIQVYGAAEADVAGCSFSGFNAQAGIGQAFAAETAQGGTLNPDFEAVNRFENQQRLWRRA